jgi:hypothetical protein
MALDILNFILNFIIIFVTSRLILDWWNNRKKEKVIDLDEESVLLVKVEQFEESNKKYWMVYKFKDDEFIAQGNSEEEAVKNTIARCPGKTIYQVSEN